VPTDFINVTVKDDEAVDQEKQHQWPQKVRRRVQHDGTWLAQCATVRAAAAGGARLPGAHDVVVARRLPDGRGRGQGRSVPAAAEAPAAPPDGGTVSSEQVRQLAQKLLQQLFAVDADAFDARWREWVLKTYAKK